MPGVREGLHSGRGPEETHADPHRRETVQLQGLREELPGQTLAKRTPQSPHGGGGAGPGAGPRRRAEEAQRVLLRSAVACTSA